MKSINEYIRDKKLPNIPELEYQTICAQLGIVYNGMDNKISQEDFNKLLNDATINKYLLNQNANNLNAAYDNTFNSVLSDTINQMTNASNKGFNDEASIMQSNSTNITDVRDANNDAFNNRQYTAVVDDNMLDFIQKARLETLDDRISKVDERLKKKYQEQLQLKNILSSSRTQFKKMITQKRLNRTNKRIAKLQQKQGRLMGEQRKIAEQAARKYKAIRDAQIAEFKQNITTSINYISAIEKITASHNDVVNDINLTNAELSNQNISKFKKIALNIDKVRLEREKNRLEREKERIEKLRNLQTRLNGLKRKAPARGTEAILNGMTMSYA